MVRGTNPASGALPLTLQLLLQPHIGVQHGHKGIIKDLDDETICSQFENRESPCRSGHQGRRKH